MVEDNPGYVLYYNLLKCLYETNPARDSVAGTIESIAEITSETLYHCHKVFYNPSNMTLSVVGNVDPDQVIALAREILPPEPGEIPESDYGTEKTAGPFAKELAVKMEVSAPQFLFGAKLPPEEKGGRTPSSDACRRDGAASALWPLRPRFTTGFTRTVCSTAASIMSLTIPRAQPC